MPTPRPRVFTDYDKASSEARRLHYGSGVLHWCFGLNSSSGMRYLFVRDADGRVLHDDGSMISVVVSLIALGLDSPPPFEKLT